MNISLFSGRKLSIILHLVAWAVILFIPVYLFTSNVHYDRRFLFTMYLHLAFYLSLFYLSYFWLIPRFFFTGKRRTYFLLSLVIIVCSYFIIDNTLANVFPPENNRRLDAEFQRLMTEYRIPRPPKQFHVFNYFVTAFLISGFSLGLRNSEKYIQNEKRHKELEQERLNSELAFLKSQVSPHFFFNTLNNIYSLIEINTADAQNAVLKLSKLMRYLLYESEQGNTRLSREIEFMVNYIDLMKLRLNHRVALMVSFPENTDNIAIPPLLFVPFVENAFKHGISYRERSFISISMIVSDGHIEFICRNSIFENANDNAEFGSGIGLDNVRKRLSLLFPHQHALNIRSDEKVFEVLLSIDTKMPQA